jgi:glycosyltransferase involved in cell wall biosynthesis
MSAPAVSVLVTTYNHARYVEEALESLRAQTSRDFETIITDDASPDGTGDVIAAWLARTRFPARFIRNPENRGICKNRNAALALASGRFVCSLSGDDAYLPERIERQLACFQRQPAEVAAVHSDAVNIDAAGRELDPSPPKARSVREPPQGRVFRHLLRENFVCAPATMLRKSAIDAVGGYDEALAYEDLDMWLRLAYRFAFVYLPGRLVRHRELPTSLSRSAAGRRSMRASDERILMRWLAADLTPDERLAVLDAVWRAGKEHLYWREDEAALRLFATVARAGAGPRQRAIERLLRLPGGRDLARSVAHTYRRLRGQPGLPP